MTDRRAFLTAFTALVAAPFAILTGKATPEARTFCNHLNPGVCSTCGDVVALTPLVRWMDGRATHEPSFSVPGPDGMSFFFAPIGGTMHTFIASRGVWYETAQRPLPQDAANA